MFAIPHVKMNQLLLIAGSIALGVVGFSALCALIHTELPFPMAYAVLAGLSIASFLFWKKSRKANRRLPQGAMAIAILIATGTTMVLATAYQLAAYISLPVDLLSFSESPFVNDILKLRLGLPIYTPPQDNNSYPYTPGTQILTYLISAAFGHGDSIPFYRAVQFCYVILAAVVATVICDLLARRALSEIEYRHRPLWITAWFTFFFLLSTDARFNLYTHSLHNDGLALLVSISAYWLIVRHSVAPRRWLLVLMAVLPALGFMVKQNQLMWAGIFFLYLATSRHVSWRQLWLFLLGSVLSIALTVGGCYLLWGDPFLYWIFRALGDKQVSLLRSVQHLFQAGIYVIMGLLGGWVLVLRGSSRTLSVLWVCWLLIFGTEVYSSGIGWQANHLGPGIMLSACWFFTALVKVWPTTESTGVWWRTRIQEGVAVCIVISLFGVLGFVRMPQNPIPSDFFRYVADIEREFQGHDEGNVLLDYGTWIYLRKNILMKDRSAPVSLHAGKNQPEVNHAMLAATIKRIEDQTYDKILARQLDTEHSAYDFQNRGSGVKAAILSNYHEAGRIPAVQGIEQWWPTHLVSEIIVFAPNRAQKEPSPPRAPATTLTMRSR